MTFASPSRSHVRGVGSKPSTTGCTRYVLARVDAKGQQAVLDKPVWTGDSWPSKLANALINTPVLYSAMKVLAYNELKGTGTKRGVPWDECVAGLQARLPELEAIKAELERPITYPAYYLKPFHAYDEGNLSWKAAFDVEPVTSVMALRTFKTETTLRPEEASVKLRSGITDRLKEFMAQHNIPAFGAGQHILDIGCSVGVSTRWLEQQFPAAQVTGLDLSPYFLAVAEERERRKPAGQRRIRYMHALAEDTGLPSASIDLVSHQFVIHECPEEVIKDFIRESARIVKPGGILMIVDNNPKSPTIQNLPPALATLMKSTEPHSDSYYATDVEACMRAAGFKHVVTLEADHRHRAVLGQAP